MKKNDQSTNDSQSKPESIVTLTILYQSNLCKGRNQESWENVVLETNEFTNVMRRIESVYTPSVALETLEYYENFVEFEKAITGYDDGNCTIHEIHQEGERLFFTFFCPKNETYPFDKMLEWELRRCENKDWNELQHLKRANEESIDGDKAMELINRCTKDFGKIPSDLEHPPAKQRV
jgi:hypothetical protein